MPNEDNKGYIVDQETNKVLGVDGDNCAGSYVMLQTKTKPENLDQMWERVTTYEEGFFTLRNLKSGLFLYNGEILSYPTIESTYTNYL